MKKIAFISITMSTVEPLSNGIRRFPQIRPVHYIDAGISERIASDGRISDGCMERMISMIAHACQDGADGIVLTCTMFSAFVSDFRKLFSVPIVAADVAMMEQAAESDGKKALICTFDRTKEPSAKLLEDCCKASGVKYVIESYLLIDAYKEAQKGNMEEHNRIICKKIEELRNQYDQIVLAQMSMADAPALLSENSAKIYTSPTAACERILKIIKQEDQAWGCS